MDVRRSTALVLGAAALCGACGQASGTSDDAAPSEVEPGDSICPETVPDLELGRPIVGDGGTLAAAVVEASPLPPRKYANFWSIEITDSGGGPLDGVTPTLFRTYMPEHGHYGEPEPTFESGAGGRIDAEIRFFMRGYWEVRLEVAAGDANDRIVFHVCAED